MRRTGLFLSADFARLWGAQTVTQFAARGSTLIFPLIAIVTFDATPSEVGLVNAAQFAPAFVVTLFAGAWLDGRRRRPAMVAAHLSRAVLLLLVPLVSLWWQDVWLLIGVAVVIGSLATLADVACHAYVPSLLPRSALVAGNSRLEVTNSITQVAAPGLGGLVVGAAGGSLSLVVVAMWFLVGAGAVLTVGHREETVAVPTQRCGVFCRIAEGGRFVMSNPLLRALAVEAGWFNLFEQAVMTLYLLYALRVLGFTPGQVGVTIALGALGAVSGSVLARWLERGIGLGHVLVGAMAVASLAPIPLLLPAHTRPVQFILCTTTFFLFSFGLTVFNIYSVSTRQRISPAYLIGRVTTTFRFIAFGTIWIGAMIGGFGAEVFGLLPLLTACTGALVLGWVTFLTVIVHNGVTSRRLDEIEEHSLQRIA